MKLKPVKDWPKAIPAYLTSILLDACAKHPTKDHIYAVKFLTPEDITIELSGIIKIDYPVLDINNNPEVI